MRSEQRPFNILGIQQVAIGGDSLEALRSLWVDTLGVTKTGEYESESENVREDILTLGEGEHPVEIDLMEPIDPESRPRVNTPPLNHIGLWVDDLATAYEWLEAQGMRFTPGASARARRVTTCVSSTPKRVMTSRSAAKAS